MSIRRLVICLSLAFVVVLLIGIPFRSQLSSQGNTTTPTVLAGRNVNMVSGTTLPGGDPWLQRQNEPSIAVSSRNPMHLLAGANDYRTVDMPTSEGDLPGKGPVNMVGDAWLGVFTSYDGGESWTSTMLPGFPQEKNSTSPLKGYRTAADPVVRCGPNGIFYYSGIAFNRMNNIGVVFVARFIDNNNIEGGRSKENGNPIEAIRYIDTKIIAVGNANKFLDKPWIAVDQPRAPMSNITVAGQSIPRHNVYIAYSAFATSGSTTGDIMFARSADCGTTWNAPTKISSGNFAHQGAVIAIKPVLGEVLVAWRRFAQTKTTPDSIFVAQSLSRGLNFQSPVKVADVAPFDQPTTEPTQSLPGGAGAGPAFRSNSYPTMAVDASGHVYLAWSQRGVGPNGDARIMVSSSYMGSSWSSPQPAASMNENASFLGHQIMPSFSFAAGKLILVWYDERYDVSATQYGFNKWIQDALTQNLKPLRHTMDVWAAVADTSKFPSLTWKSTQVSRYLFAALKDDHGDLVRDANNNPLIFPAQFNCVNYTMFKGGLDAFVGDYIDVAASQTFRIDTWRNWYFNATSSDSPVFHVAWTDNRDVRPPLNGDWTAYTPATSEQSGEFMTTPVPGSPGHPTCSGGNAPGMRNQNIYTSRVTWGIEAGSPTNFKPLNLSQAARAFVVYVKNNTASSRHYRLTVAAQPIGGQASFDQFDLLTTLDVDIAAYSTISRTVFISSTDQTAPVTINIDEIDALGNVITGGLESSILLNGDPANPQVPAIDETHNPNIINSANPNIINWYVNPNIINPNIINHNIFNPNIINPNIINPNIINPNIINYDLSNPNIINPNIINPNIINPNIINVSNPNIINPNIINPNIINPNIINATTPENNSITDVSWTVTNTGTATTAYTLKTLSKMAPPEGVYVQLLVYRVHYTPAVAGAELSASGISGCELKQEPHHELVLSIVNPNIINPNIINPNIINPNIINSSIENATFSVAPGEEVTVDLRVLDTGSSQTKVQSQGLMKAMASGTFTVASSVKDFIDSLGFAVTSQAVNSVDARQGIQIPPAAATELVIGTSSLPDGVVGTGYSATLNAYGGGGSYSWSLNSGELPPPLTISSTGVISGIPSTPGTYKFIVRVDAGDQFDTQQYSILINPSSGPSALAIVTTSLPSGVQGFWYGATIHATGGVWPRTWSLAGGSLPAGLSLDSGGTISGTPTLSGTFSFTVRVTDAGGGSVARPLTLTIASSTTTHYKISGTVYDENGYPLNGAVLRGLPNTPVSGANGTPGYYEDTVPAGWSGTTEAFQVGYTFVPANRTYSNLGADTAAQDFNGTLAATEQWAQTNSTGKVQTLRDMAVDTAGSIYLTGSNGGQIYTVKYDRGGTRLWEAPLIGTAGNNSHGDAIFVSPTGDVFVSGKIDDADIFTVKYDGATGAILWSGQYDGGYPADEGADIAVDAMGDIYVTGWIWNANGNPDYCTIKYRYDSGAHTYQSAWTRIFDGGGHDVAHNIGIDAAGNIIVSGSSFGGSTLDDIYIIKYDSAGNELWHSRYDAGVLGAETNDYANDLRLDSAGNIYVTGYKRAWPNETNAADYLTVKFNSSGTIQWAASYDGHGGAFDDIANALAVGPGGSVYVTGRSGARTDGSNVYDDYATIKYDSTGHAVWTPGGGIDSRGAARYDGPPGTDQDVAYSIGVDIQGSVYVTGASVGLDGSFDFATLKYSNSGARLWAQRYGENNHMDDQAKTLALDPLGSIIVAGTSGSDLLILKYAQDFSAHLVITTDVLPAGVAGAGYSATLQAFGGTGSRTWGVSGLPPGLALDGSSGLITGAPSTPGNYNLTVTVSDGPLNDTRPVSLSIAGGGAPFQLAFAQGPSNTGAGAVITPPVRVEVRDQWGNLVTTATNIVTLSLRNANGTALSGTNPKAAVGGIATFDDLSVNTVGTGYALRANSGSLKEVDSDAFTITGAVPSIIQVETAPDGSGAIVPAQNVPSGSSITVYAISRGAGGNFIENAAADSWSLVNKTGGAVDGDLVVAGGGKSAVFTGHLIGSAQIHVAKSPLTSIDSGVLAVTGGAAGKIAITGPPSADGGFISQAFTITSQDDSGNPVNVPQDAIFRLTSTTMGIGTFYSDSGGTTPITQVQMLSSQSTAQFYYMDSLGGSRTITATWVSGGTNLGYATHQLTIKTGAGRIVFSSDRDGNNEIYLMNADGAGQTRLTNDAADDSDPCLSSDGSKIVFMSNRDGNREIYIMNADGSGQTRLTNNAAYDSFPSFSPDGSKVVFISDRDAGNYEIYIMNSDGSGQIRLTTDPAVDEFPRFSHDGTKIVFNSARNGNDQIYIMNADGSGQIRLTNNAAMDENPCFSPDGTRIVFASNRTGNWEIYAMNADGSGQINLTNNPAVDAAPSFSRDGSKIAFHSGRDGNYEIYVMNADGSGQLRLTSNPATDNVPYWGGSKLEFIAFSSDRSGNYEIYIMNADGSGQTNLTNNPGWDGAPSWGLGGTKIAFFSDRDGNVEIYVMNADGSGQTRLTNNAAYDGTPSWSPDGSKIAFMSERDGNTQIYVMNADGSGQTRLTTNSARDQWPDWSPDGSKIAFFSDRDGNTEIYVMNADGSGQTRLTNNTASDRYPCYSPDGSRIAFTSNRDGNDEIYVMNADGSGQTRLTNNTVSDSTPSWSPDGSRIAYSSEPSGSGLTFEIYIMNSDGSGQTRLTNNTSNDLVPSWRSHPKVPDVYEFVTKWGAQGSADGQFFYPYGIAVDSSGNVYVADTSNNRIQKFSSTGSFVTKWGTQGSADGQINHPYGIAVDSSGNVYVADTMNNRIQKFSSTGSFVTKWGSGGSGDSQFSSPWGIAVDSSGYVYVVDCNNNRIQKFSSTDGINYTFVTKWGTQGSADGQINHPSGIAVDSSGNVYVAEESNYRIQKFSSIDGINYTFVTKWGTQGSGDGQFESPFGIAVDISGNVYVADTFNDRIQKFSSAGSFVTKWGSSGSEDGQFFHPSGIAVDSSGNVYVAEESNHRIQKFRKK